jgi:hypothetical protein
MKMLRDVNVLTIKIIVKHLGHCIAYVYAAVVLGWKPNNAKVKTKCRLQIIRKKVEKQP